MGYKSLVKANVKRAFASIGDLAIVVTLTQTNKESYDFTAETPETTTPTTVQIRAVELRASRPDKNAQQSKLKKLLINADDLSDPDIYDSLTLPDGSVWRFVPPYQNNGYTITVSIAREA